MKGRVEGRPPWVSIRAAASPQVTTHHPIPLFSTTVFTKLHDACSVFHHRPHFGCRRQCHTQPGYLEHKRQISQQPRLLRYATSRLFATIILILTFMQSRKPQRLFRQPSAATTPVSLALRHSLSLLRITSTIGKSLTAD